MMNQVHDTRRRRSLPILAVLAALALVAACGNDDDAASDGRTTEPAAGDEVAADQATNEAVCGGLSSPSDPIDGLTSLGDRADGELRNAIGRAADAFATEDMAGALAAADELTALCRDEGVDIDPAAVFEAAWQLSADEVNPTYECEGADPDSASVLVLLGDGPLEFEPEVRIDPIAPVPSEGEELTATFTGAFELDADLVAGVIAAGITEATVADLSLAVHAGDGVTGDDLVGLPPDERFELAEGEPVRLQVGPFESSYTRTAPLGAPVTFTTGTLALTVSTSLAGNPVNVNLTCEPIAGADIVLREVVAG